MTCNVIATGSTGNAVLYDGSILVDCGVSYSTIKPYVNSLGLVVLTHVHNDHCNLGTIKKLSFERPSLRFACGEWMIPYLKCVRNVDFLELNNWYDYGQFKIMLLKAYHDVPNCLIRLDINGYKIFHATDTNTLEGVEAKHYALYAIESNYSEETVHESIKAIEDNGGYAYQKGAIETHLSDEQAKDFYFKNRHSESKFIRLHESKNK